MKKVLGIGAALVDLICRVDDTWISKTGSSKGGMTLITFQTLKKLSRSLSAPQIISGGSACNTMAGIAKLGGKSAFFSKVGRDRLGNFFSNHLKNCGIENKLQYSSSATGTVLSAVTPDSERTMFTFLGASNELRPNEISADLFNNVSILYLEGYMAYSEEIFAKAIREARKMNVKIAMDFGSFEVVRDCRAFFNRLFAGREIDIVLANESEAKAYTGSDYELALKKLAKLADIAVVKIGKRGSLISKDGNTVHIKCGEAKAIDTTGAGDLWASGFIFGLISGYSIEAAGNLGSIVSNEVVQVAGACIPDDGWIRIKEEMKHV